MTIDTFPWKNGDLPNVVVDFLRRRDTFRKKIMGIVKDFNKKSYNNGKPSKSSRILRVKPNFFIFSCFSFFSFYHFSHFSHFFKKFIFFHFLSFSFSLLGAQNLIFFGLKFRQNLETKLLCVKIIFWAHLGVYTFGPSFPFFPLFFSAVFLSLFLPFIFSCFFIFCSFLHFLIF